MRTKRLGRTELELPVVGIGTAFVGIPTQNETVADQENGRLRVDQELGVQTLVTAIDAGCTFFDTAVLYNRSLSETMIGEALRQRPSARGKVTISTKAGRRFDGYDFSFDGIVSSVNGSLERLGLDSLDIVYIHDAMGQPMDDQCFQTVARWVPCAICRIRELSDTSAPPPTIRPPIFNYIKTGEFDAAVIADSWSLINLTAEKEIFAAAAKHDVGLIGATPLERSLLVTGPKESAKYLNRIFSQDCLDQVSKIQQLCQGYEVPMLAVALQWCTRHPQVASAIPGARVPEEAATSIAAALLEIPDALWTDLEPLAQHFDTAIDV